MPDSVVDASVLGAYLFGEPRRDEAKELMGNGQWFAPSLLPYELTSIALTKTKTYPEKRGKIFDALSIGLDLEGLQLVEPDYRQTLTLAEETGLTTYDASYLLLSDVLSLPLLTFDEELRKATAE